MGTLRNLWLAVAVGILLAPVIAWLASRPLGVSRKGIEELTRQVRGLLVLGAGNARLVVTSRESPAYFVVERVQGECKNVELRVRMRSGGEQAASRAANKVKLGSKAGGRVGLLSVRKIDGGEIEARLLVGDIWNEESVREVARIIRDVLHDARFPVHERFRWRLHGGRSWRYLNKREHADQ